MFAIRKTNSIDSVTMAGERVRHTIRQTLWIMRATLKCYYFKRNDAFATVFELPPIKNPDRTWPEIR